MNEPPADLATADQTAAERAAALDEQERQAEAATPDTMPPEGERFMASSTEHSEPWPPVNRGVGYPPEPLPPDPVGDGIEDRGREVEWDDDGDETFRIVTLEFVSSEETSIVWGKVLSLIQSAESKKFRLMDGSVEDASAAFNLSEDE